MKCKKVFFCFSMPQLTSTGFFLGRFGEVAWISLRFNVAAELLASTGLGLCLGLVFPEASRGRTPDDRGNFRVPWAPKSTLGLGFPNKILMDWFPYKVMLDQIDFCWVKGDLHLIIFYHFQKKTSTWWNDMKPSVPRLSMQLLTVGSASPSPRLLRSLGALGKHLTAEGVMGFGRDFWKNWWKRSGERARNARFVCILGGKSLWIRPFFSPPVSVASSRNVALFS